MRAHYVRAPDVRTHHNSRHQKSRPYNMINRTLIRQKVVQLVYAYYQNGNNNIEQAEKELYYSLSKAYELYHYMLTLIIEITRYAERQLEHKNEINKAAHIDREESRRFVDNQFAQQLAHNKALTEYTDKKKLTWHTEMAYIKYLYDTIVKDESYIEYMQAEETSYAADRELWRKIYKSIISKDERLDEVIEDKSLYWNDDRTIVDTFILKTIKRFDPVNGEEQELQPEYHDEDDRQFASRLFRRSIMNADTYHSLISHNTRNWDFSRLAFMDVVIMQVATAEICSFAEIPTSVTINEYVEIAKWYSTPKSRQYVNGILDAIVRSLKSENKIMKD